jgi:hypothetical protein
MRSYLHCRRVESQAKSSLLIFSKLHGIIDGRNAVNAIAKTERDGRVGADSVRMSLSGRGVRPPSSFILQKSRYSARNSSEKEDTVCLSAQLLYIAICLTGGDCVDSSRHCGYIVVVQASDGDTSVICAVYS